MRNQNKRTSAQLFFFQSNLGKRPFYKLRKYRQTQEDQPPIGQAQSQSKKKTKQ